MFTGLTAQQKIRVWRCVCFNNLASLQTFSITWDQSSEPNFARVFDTWKLHLSCKKWMPKGTNIWRKQNRYNRKVSARHVLYTCLELISLLFSLPVNSTPSPSGVRDAENIAVRPESRATFGGPSETSEENKRWIQIHHLEPFGIWKI